jgi:Ala-tRNA(Pro) deacylase
MSSQRPSSTSAKQALELPWFPPTNSWILAKLGRLLELSSMRLANEAELAALFPDCELGAMPPFGDACDLPVIVDAGIAGDFIAFTIGTHRDVVRISFADFQRLAKPTVASFAIGEEVLV